MTTLMEGIVELPQVGFIKITGFDAKKLLQGQLTCHLDEVTSSQSRLGAHCNPKGRIISLFRIFQWHDDYYLQMPKISIPIALQALKKYAVFYKVTLSDASNELSVIGFMGESIDIPLPQNINDINQYESLFIIKMPGDSSRYQIMGNKVDIDQYKEKLMKQFSLVDPKEWEIQNINAELMQIYPETSEKFLPHEINLPLHGGVSFTKGCYTGQEIIARMQYRGKLKNELKIKTITASEPLIRGNDFSPTECIVDFCEINNQHYVILLLSSSDTGNT